MLNEPQPNSPESQQALEDLERYYLEFPLILISYNEIRLLHQVEAMIWFHGIFLLLGISQNLAFLHWADVSMQMVSGISSVASRTSCGFRHLLL